MVKDRSRVNMISRFAAKFAVKILVSTGFFRQYQIIEKHQKKKIDKENSHSWENKTCCDLIENEYTLVHVQ